MKRKQANSVTVLRPPAQRGIEPSLDDTNRGSSPHRAASLWLHGAIVLALVLLLPATRADHIDNPPLDGGMVHYMLTYAFGTLIPDETINDHHADMIGSGLSFEEVDGITPLTVSANSSTVALPDVYALDHLAETSHTLSIWFKPDHIPGANGTTVNFPALMKSTMFGIRLNSDGRFYANFHQSSGGATVISSPQYTDWTKWYHLVQVVDYSQGEMRLYVDGQQVATTTFNASYPATSTTAPWRIGYVPAGRNQWSARGSFWEAKIYDHALTSSEVADLYVPPDLDSDGDGIPDWWKLHYFGHLDYDAYDDPNETGYPLIYEYVHGTDPTDPNSIPEPHFIVDRTQEEGGNVFHDIKSAVEEANSASEDYQIVEVAPGVYTGPENFRFTIEGPKMLLRGKEGSEATVIEGIPYTDVDPVTRQGILVKSEAAIAGFSIRDFDPEVDDANPVADDLSETRPLTFVDVPHGMVADVRLGGWHHYWDARSALHILNSSLRIDRLRTGDSARVTLQGNGSNQHKVQIKNSRFENFVSLDAQPSGGAILASHVQLSILKSDFVGNKASFGGAISLGNDVKFIVRKSLFINNESLNDGGAIAHGNVGNAVLVENCTFIGNQAGNRGGAYRQTFGDDNLVIIDCEFYENTANSGLAQGGALSLFANTKLHLERVSLIGNSAGNGAAIHFGTSSSPGNEVTLVNSILADNESTDADNAVVYFSGVNAYITNCTFIDNIPGATGEVINLDVSNSGEIVNTLFWNPQASSDLGPITTGLFVSHSNIKGQGSGFSGGNNLYVDPLVNVYGLLLADSPMRDEGTSSGAPSDDIHGESRPFGSAVDIGADEFVDTGGLGLPDWWQMHYFGSLSNHPNANPDGDGLTNLEEYVLGTDPTNPDTNGDGIWDGFSPDSDSNWDGVASSFAVLIGLDPYNQDHSENSVSNFEALAFGLDPFDPDDMPVDGLIGFDPQNPPSIELHEPQGATPLN